MKLQTGKISVRSKLHGMEWLWWVSHLLMFAALLILSSGSAKAQGMTGKKARSSKKMILILPDGRVLAPDRIDSLEEAWGTGRIAFSHDEADDAKGIVHLIRVTDEMKAKSDSLESEKREPLNSLLNKPAPAFNLRDLDGKDWTLNSLRGKIVVLNFWFTTCLPCIKEMPELNALVAAYSDMPVIFLALTFNNREQVKAFHEKTGLAMCYCPVQSRWMSNTRSVHGLPVL